MATPIPMNKPPQMINSADFLAQFNQAKTAAALYAQTPLYVQLDDGQTENLMLCANFGILYTVYIDQFNLWVLLLDQTRKLWLDSLTHSTMGSTEQQEDWTGRLQELKLFRRYSGFHGRLDCNHTGCGSRMT